MVIVSDPVYNDIVLNPEIREEIQQAAEHAKETCTIYRYDTTEDRGGLQQLVDTSAPEYVILSPALSHDYITDRDTVFSSLIDQWRSKEASLILTISQKRYDEITYHGLAIADYYLIDTFASGWEKVDSALSEAYTDPHKIGILCQDRYDVENLFPLLFKDTLMQPEVVQFEDSQITKAQIRQAVDQFSKHNVEVVCILLGADTIRVLPQLENSDMLAVIERGRYLSDKSPHIIGSIEIDYAAAVTELMKSLKLSDGPRGIPLQGVYVVYENQVTGKGD